MDRGGFPHKREVQAEQYPHLQSPRLGWRGSERYLVPTRIAETHKDNDNLWKIENVLKKRKRGGRTELFVKWMGWPKKFGSWVSENEVKNI